MYVLGKPALRGRGEDWARRCIVTGWARTGRVGAVMADIGRARSSSLRRRHPGSAEKGRQQLMGAEQRNRVCTDERRQRSNSNGKMERRDLGERRLVAMRGAGLRWEAMPMVNSEPRAVGGASRRPLFFYNQTSYKKAGWTACPTRPAGPCSSSHGQRRLFGPGGTETAAGTVTCPTRIARCLEERHHPS
jgi:hypothetical protein